MKKRKQRRLTSILTITTSQESTSKHPRPVSSLLKGLIKRKDKNRETKLSNAVRENRASKSTLCIGIKASECALSKE